MESTRDSTATSKPCIVEGWKIPVPSERFSTTGSDISVNRPVAQKDKSADGAQQPLNGSPMHPQQRPHFSVSLSNCTAMQKKPYAHPFGVKRAADDERTQAEKRADTAFLVPNVPRARISRVSGLSAERHEHLAIANAKKIEALKLSMAEVVPTGSKGGKRPNVSVETGTPPKKRGRPKGTTKNGLRAAVLARSVATQSCLDLSDRRTHCPAQLATHAQSSHNLFGVSHKFGDGATALKKLPYSSNDVDGSLNPNNTAATRNKAISPNKEQETETNASGQHQTGSGDASASAVPDDSYSDGELTPPLSIVEDFGEHEKAGPSKATEQEVHFATPLPPSQTKARIRQKKSENDSGMKVHSLIKELNSLLSSCQGRQKINMAYSLQRIIDEAKETKETMSAISRLEKETNGRIKQLKDELTQLLNQHVDRCDERMSSTNDALLKLRSEVSRIGDQTSSLRQTSVKHTADIETLHKAAGMSGDSIQKVAADLTSKMDQLKQECQKQFPSTATEEGTQKNSYVYNGFFPPPPPPPPPLQQKVARESTCYNKQLSVSCGSDAQNTAIANQPPILPVPPPFFGPFLPPAQKVMYDYFHMHQLQQQLQQHHIPLPVPPPFLPNMLVDGAAATTLTQHRSAHEHRTPPERPEGHHVQRHPNKCTTPESNDYVQKQRR
ncbi:hypothetical protein Q1695_005394 [Nippostrongylus brasiliensis]|nr:hypothetical protein Q1695_005394 [Nippostrongylus brasiliensis]